MIINFTVKNFKSIKNNGDVNFTVSPEWEYMETIRYDEYGIRGALINALCASNGSGK